MFARKKLGRYKTRGLALAEISPHQSSRDQAPSAPKTPSVEGGKETNATPRSSDRPAPFQNRADGSRANTHICTALTGETAWASLSDRGAEISEKPMTQILFAFTCLEAAGNCVHDLINRPVTFAPVNIERSINDRIDGSRRGYLSSPPEMFSGNCRNNAHSRWRDRGGLPAFVANHGNIGLVFPEVSCR